MTREIRRGFELSAHAVRFVRSRRPVIDGVDLRLVPGTITALVGPNGAGKSTLLHILAGVDTPSGGGVTLDGRPLTSVRPRERARTLALVEQDANTEMGLSCFDVALLGRTPHVGPLGAPDPEDAAFAMSALVRCGVGHLARRPFQRISGGERQRVMIARALAQDPTVMILDEPTNHLDIGAQLDVFRMLREFSSDGLTVVVAVHDLNLALRHADIAILIDDGRVVAAGRSHDVLTPGRIRRVYGVEAEILVDSRGSRHLGFVTQ